MKTWDDLVEIGMYAAMNDDNAPTHEWRGYMRNTISILTAIRDAGVRLMPSEVSNDAAITGMIAQSDAQLVRDLGVSAMKAAYTAMVAADEIKPQEADLTARDGRNDGGTGNDATGL